MFTSSSELMHYVPHLRLAIFGVLIIVFLVAEPDGLNKLWLNARDACRRFMARRTMQSQSN
jgi:branched-chain amino acid transport system permease protein